MFFKKCNFTVIFDGCPIAEEFKSRVPFDAIFFGEFRFFGSVDLSKFDVGVLAGEILSGFGVFWGQSFAMSAPRGIYA